MTIIDVAVRQENFNFGRTATIYALEKHLFLVPMRPE